MIKHLTPNFVFLLVCLPPLIAQIPKNGLLLDLDASKGITLEDNNRVAVWANQAPGEAARMFVKQDDGRKEKGSGRPTLRSAVPELNGKPSIVFKRQELVCPDEDTFDKLTTGSGHTWIVVIAAHSQVSGLKDVNSFFGNLRNGDKYDGVWGCFNDDNTLWYGTRNGLSFGRFDKNNPQLLGPKLETNRFHIAAGRMAAGTGVVTLELFLNEPKPIATGKAPVVLTSNPSRMTIGQERDAIEHPGYESFDGEIARFLIWERPLLDDELSAAIQLLRTSYFQAEN